MFLKADWKTPQDVKAQSPKASILSNNRVVFDIKGGSYRLVVAIDYKYRQAVYIRLVGTHDEYDKINAEEV